MATKYRGYTITDTGTTIDQSLHGGKGNRPLYSITDDYGNAERNTLGNLPIITTIAGARKYIDGLHGQTYTHAIIYIGAPYGDGEKGHIFSKHRSEDNANARFDRESRDSQGNKTTFHLNHEIVTLDRLGDWSRQPTQNEA